MGKGPDHRGVIDNLPEFARRFIEARLAGFDKDMAICLKPAKSKTGPGLTHAYFPALGACCGTLEYLAALYNGNIGNVGWNQVASWSNRFLPQPDYDRETVRILVLAFRNSVNHRGIATGVWVDQRPGAGHGNRFTWKVLADARRPACEIIEEIGALRKDPPWPCSYTHRVHIHLKSLQVDIRKGGRIFAREITAIPRLQRNFEACMNQLYPQ